MLSKFLNKTVIDLYLGQAREMLLNLIKRGWHLVISAGVHDGLSYREQREVNTVNTVNVFVLFTTFSLFILNIISGKYIPAAINISMIFIACLPLAYLNTQRRYKLAAGIFFTQLTIGIASVAIISTLNHRKVSSETIFFASGLLGLFLFGGIKKYVAFGVSVILFFLIKLFKLRYWQGDNNEDFAFGLINAFTTFFVVFIIAILYRKFFDKYEEAISRKSKDLELLNAEKNKLFSIIAHDLRAPLGNLNQTLSLVASGTLTNEEMSIIMKKLSENAVYTGEMLDNLLNWSNTQMKGKKVMVEKFKIKNIVISIINQYQLLAEAKNIVIENNIADTIEVEADKNMIQLVVRNLLSNAIKFSHRNSYIQLNAVKENNRVVVSITDAGVGMSPEDMKEIFNNITFTRLGTTGEKGTGLGLPMCKEFITLNNGTIWIDSQQDNGTTISFSLPC